ncbi:hypothetical protein [Flavihumibacter profundi]|jgi:hypothetical protein|uniref:hypothetical protein n=1 Tax=Flavihumibacter profundi TaxID=2716883 RepID=UPI001CC5A09C|nr:hypothetical protein [Flavihumibacter profundi]MBZ5858254.1 hypothetical protein [Flavihumibacter profundi]
MKKHFSVLALGLVYLVCIFSGWGNALVFHSGNTAAGFHQLHFDKSAGPKKAGILPGKSVAGRSVIDGKTRVSKSSSPGMSVFGAIGQASPGFGTDIKSGISVIAIYKERYQHYCSHLL